MGSPWLETGLETCQWQSALKPPLRPLIWHGSSGASAQTTAWKSSLGCHNGRSRLQAMPSEWIGETQQLPAKTERLLNLS
eukprot:1835144-Amphidinium_carterae.1